MRFELQKNLLNRYFRLVHTLGFGIAITSMAATILFIMIMEQAPAKAVWLVLFMSIGLTVLYAAAVRWYTTRFANALAYTVEDNILYIEEGVFTYQRKAIPLDRVTDIRLVQDIVMRRVGIWKLQVQTASLGQLGAEGTLWAIEQPKAVRNQLIAQRQSAVTAQRVEPAA